MHFDELVRLLIRTACTRGQEEGAKAACSSKRPSAKITLDTPNGGTITVDLGVAVSGWALLGLGIVAMIVLKCLGRVQFDFGRAGHRLGGERRRHDDVDKAIPPRSLAPATAPPALIGEARPIPALPAPAPRPVSLPLRPFGRGACPEPDEETTSMKSAASDLERFS